MPSHSFTRNFWKTLAAVTLITFTAAASSFWILYRAAYDERGRELERAVETLASLMESVAQFDSKFSEQTHPQGTLGATMSQIEAGLGARATSRVGEELVIGQKVGNQLRILRPTAEGFEIAAELDDGSERGRQLREALEGRHQFGKFLDYRGIPVLAAFASIPTLQIGIVYKTDLSSVRAPFIRAAGWSSTIYFVMIGVFIAGYWMLAKRFESRLATSESRLDSVFEAAPALILILDAKGNIERVNPAFEQLTGWESTDLVGREWFSTCLPDRDRDRIRALFHTAIDGVSTRGHVNPILTSSGEEREIEWHDQTLRDAAGYVVSLLTVGIDVTDRKRLEKALWQSEEQVRLALRAAGQGFYDLDLTTGRAEVSPEYATMIGYDPVTFEETNSSWSERLHPDDRDRVYEVFEAYLRGEAPDYEVEFRQRTRMGEWLWTLSIGSIVGRDADGKPLRMMGTHTNIDTRRRAEQALQDKETQLRAVVEGISEGILMADMETQRFTFGNSAMARMLAVTRDELLTLGLADLHPPEVLPKAQRLFEAAASGEVMNLSYLPILRRDGSQLSTEISVSAILLNGRRYLLGVFHDITEREQQEEALRESEARYRRAERGTNDGLWEWTIATGEEYFSPRWLSILGYGEGELSNTLEAFSYLIHPDDREQVGAAMDRHLQQREPFDVEMRMLHKTGDYLWIRSRGEAERGADGNAIRMTGSISDIAGRKQVEEALLENETRLKEAQRVAGVGSWELDLVSGHLEWSAEVFRLFEIDPEKINPSLGVFLDAIHPEDRDAVDSAYASSLQNGGRYRITHRLLMSDGRIKHVEEQCETDLSEDGTPLRSRGTVQDVTEREESERRIRDSLHEKETLLREIHHRVKNNLQIVSSLLHFQAKKLVDPTAVSVFDEARERLRSMILVHEKLYNSKDLSEVDFADYVKSLVEELTRPTLGAADRARFRVVTEPLRLPIETALPTGMILVELVTNIMKYAFPPGRSGEAEVRLSAADGRVYLTVSDNGAGLPPDFDPRNSRSFGWQLINNLVEQLDGEVTIDREAGTRIIISYARKA